MLSLNTFFFASEQEKTSSNKKSHTQH